ncbi:LysR family transcriptional regulator [Pseudomonas glycinae]|uniref:LysR family transcriptional regulator n=1 Tax=Pseudomonas TaxID=286 RepID=UPI0018D91D41|nr:MULTISPECIES: LysR family transcriptional regulator [Pseudomonas]MBH3404716.1 LysR family transcriptional regulator [Pseudomonas glycinae]MDI3397469.1 LysR substrate-binding domain-containing protein [Pseudomonas sp. V88_4]
MIIFPITLKNFVRTLQNFVIVKKIVRVDDLQVFVTTAAAGSFSAAARLLDISPALASGAVQRLEGSLGARLFVRSTRRLRLSDDGERYLSHARQALEALENGEIALSEGRDEIAGTIRLSIPSDIGRNVLLRWLDDFQQLHPKVLLQLRVSDQIADLVGEQLDASIRYGLLADSSLVSLALAPSNRRTVCASPDYLARHGRPAAPEELGNHNCLRFVMGEQTYERWSFHSADGVRTVQVTGDRVSDDADIVRRWAVAGFGIVYRSKIDVLDDLRSGRLVELFPADVGQPAPLQLVCPHRTSLTPAVQALRTFLAQRFERYVAQ